MCLYDSFKLGMCRGHMGTPSDENFQRPLSSLDSRGMLERMEHCFSAFRVSTLAQNPELLTRGTQYEKWGTQNRTPSNEGCKHLTEADGRMDQKGSH